MSIHYLLTIPIGPIRQTTSLCVSPRVAALYTCDVSSRNHENSPHVCASDCRGRCLLPPVVLHMAITHHDLQVRHVEHQARRVNIQARHTAVQASFRLLCIKRREHSLQENWGKHWPWLRQQKSTQTCPFGSPACVEQQRQRLSGKLSVYSVSAQHRFQLLAAAPRWSSSFARSVTQLQVEFALTSCLC